MASYYEILDIDKNVDMSIVRETYMKKALQYHPDKNGGKESEEFLKIKEAYDTLSDEDLRGIYDFLGNHEKYQKMRESISIYKDGYVKNPYVRWLFDLLVIQGLNYRLTKDYTKSDLIDDIKEGKWEKIIHSIIRALKDQDPYFDIAVKNTMIGRFISLLLIGSRTLDKPKVRRCLWIGGTILVSGVAYLGYKMLTS